MAAWATVTTLILLVPLLAMQVTDQVDWDGADFAFVGALLVGAGVAFELAARKTVNSAYRAAVGVALGAAFLLVWVNGAVGILGSEDNPANLMYGGVLAVGIVGAVIARFRADGMAHAVLATGLAQALVAGIALIAGAHQSPISSVAEILGVNGLFVALWLLAGWLFRKAAREQTPAGVTP